jgi:hypothetical protein
VSLLVLAGCGGSAEKFVPAKGKVLKDGKPIAVGDPNTESVQIMFYPLEEAAQAKGMESARTEADGSFNIWGINGKGILPGKYRIGVRQVDTVNNVDKLEGKFDDPNAPITRDVTGQEIVIDLSKPEG